MRICVLFFVLPLIAGLGFAQEKGAAAAQEKSRRRRRCRGEPGFTVTKRFHRSDVRPLFGVAAAARPPRGDAAALIRAVASSTIGK